MSSKHYVVSSINAFMLIYFEARARTMGQHFVKICVMLFI